MTVTPRFGSRRVTHPQVPAKVVVYDLEFTAWQGSLTERWLRPGHFREVVQIGAVQVDTHTLDEEAAFEILVRPLLNPTLSPYFEALTGITNADVAERGVDFANAYMRFVAFSRNATTFAFGRDDLIFVENFRLYGLRNLPPAPQYRNIAPWLRAHGLHPRHAGDVAEAAGVPFAGQKHDALYDARSVLRGVRALVANGAANPFLDQG